MAEPCIDMILIMQNINKRESFLYPKSGCYKEWKDYIQKIDLQHCRFKRLYYCKLWILNLTLEIRMVLCKDVLCRSFWSVSSYSHLDEPEISSCASKKNCLQELSKPQFIFNYNFIKHHSGHTEITQGFLLFLRHWKTPSSRSSISYPLGYQEETHLNYISIKNSVNFSYSRWTQE